MKTFVGIAMNFLSKLVIDSGLAISICSIPEYFLRKRTKL